MKSKSMACIWMVVFALCAMSGAALADNTPFWWDNPQGYQHWTRVVATGTASNTGPQAQFVIAKIDVPNEYRENASKNVWVQVEWSLVYGSGQLTLGFTDHMILWHNDPLLCPTDPTLPFPSPPSGVAFMVYEGPFAPAPEFQHGNEFSYSGITPQPACERSEIRFEVNSESRIDYRIEIQTLCVELDFGDAPDPTFPTLLANDGARHMIVPDVNLGAAVDYEMDGQPHASAAGDDLNNMDDEDGVTFLSSLTQARDADITVTTGMAGILNGWIDFNGDGDWQDASEHIFVNTLLGSSGSHNLTFTVPADAQIGPTFARFRFSTESGLSFTGLARDGEVEDYQVAIDELRYDFGDAPDPTFPTLLASDGARHAILQGFHLGDEIDWEMDGLQSVNALGDDNAQSPNDEDGVTFPPQLVQGTNATVTVNASAAGLLHAWIDFNDDGDWDDAGEHIFQNQALSAGDNALNFAVPLTHQPDAMVYARFRLSDSRTIDLPYYGSAPSGEVEDYRVSLIVPVELSSFTATFTVNGVSLQWMTQSESENLGFNIYRSEDEKGDYVRINDELIAGAGYSASAKYYQYIDRNVEAGKTYFYKLADVSFEGNARMHEAISITITNPSVYQLEQNYPNPFNPETKIAFRIKEAGLVTLNVYNTLGQLIRTLVDEHKRPGYYSARWNGMDSNGNMVPSGIYIYKLKTEHYEASKTMQFLK
ncbi:T9SS type A sorting domain-containing protein [candidate division KSB1 bacterium]|nr:T9SS type A sorting domain-containing protein [candidate division KSB1 bacterium]